MSLLLFTKKWSRWETHSSLAHTFTKKVSHIPHEQFSTEQFVVVVAAAVAATFSRCYTLSSQIQTQTPVKVHAHTFCTKGTQAARRFGYVYMRFVIPVHTYTLSLCMYDMDFDFGFWFFCATLLHTLSRSRSLSVVRIRFYLHIHHVRLCLCTVRSSVRSVPYGSGACGLVQLCLCLCLCNAQQTVCVCLHSTNIALTLKVHNWPNILSERIRQHLSDSRSFSRTHELHLTAPHQ